MKGILLAAGLLVAGDAYSSCSSQTVGSATFHTCSDGTRGTTHNVGSTGLHSFNDGTTGTSHTVGDTTLHNLSNGSESYSGTTYRIGDTTVQSWQDGGSSALTPLRETPDYSIGGTSYYD